MLFGVRFNAINLCIFVLCACSFDGIVETIGRITKRITFSFCDRNEWEKTDWDHHTNTQTMAEGIFFFFYYSSSNCKWFGMTRAKLLNREKMSQMVVVFRCCFFFKWLLLQWKIDNLYIIQSMVPAFILGALIFLFSNLPTPFTAVPVFWAQCNPFITRSNDSVFFSIPFHVQAE